MIKINTIDIDTTFTIEEERIDIDEKILDKFPKHKAERGVMEYFKSKGCITVLGSNIEYFDFLDEIPKTKIYKELIQKNINVDVVKKIQQIGTVVNYINPRYHWLGGYPDILVIDEKNKNFFFCEVKFKSDTLRENQALFYFLVKEVRKICDCKIIRVNEKPKIYKFKLRDLIELIPPPQKPVSSIEHKGIIITIESHAGRFKTYKMIYEEHRKKVENILLKLKKLENKKPKTNLLEGKIENLKFRLFKESSELFYDFCKNFIENIPKNGFIDFNSFFEELNKIDGFRQISDKLIENIMKKIFEDTEFLDFYKNMDKRKKRLLYQFLKNKYGYNKKLSQTIVFEMFISNIKQRMQEMYLKEKPRHRDLPKRKRILDRLKAQGLIKDD
jgi:hypothetical protein